MQKMLFCELPHGRHHSQVGPQPPPPNCQPGALSKDKKTLTLTLTRTSAPLHAPCHVSSTLSSVTAAGLAASRFETQNKLHRKPAVS